MMLNTFAGTEEPIWRVAVAIDEKEQPSPAAAADDLSAWKTINESIASIVIQSPQHLEAMREIARELHHRYVGPPEFDPLANPALGLLPAQKPSGLAGRLGPQHEK